MILSNIDGVPGGRQAVAAAIAKVVVALLPARPCQPKPSRRPCWCCHPSKPPVAGLGWYGGLGGQGFGLCLIAVILFRLFFKVHRAQTAVGHSLLEMPNHCRFGPWD